MITVRWIERLWEAKKYRQLATELLQNRPEGMVDCFSAPEDAVGSRAATAAALSLIRLDELTQSNAPLSRKLLRTLLACQQSDGGWGGLFTSALCTRALLCSQGNGVAVERAMEFFALLQKPEGIWPREPVRRMPADALGSALILMELGDAPVFQLAVRLDAAMQWFEVNVEQLDAETRMIWSHARLRCSVRHTRETVTLWS